MRKRLAPVHPGVILKKDMLEPEGLTPYRLAKNIGVPQQRLSEILRGRRAITGDTALRLARFFGTSAEFWMNLQARYDLELAKDRMGARALMQIVPLAKLETNRPA